ncbi:FAD/NAD(P)-binding domain-containing protein [Choiromyces venosus 120613-1]|uniref:FAD/NAD(P)-binding domain-containing protein n=1 Tax=Choiromyces venosus 120613-1 TaxID=1336337 RepID=A0A3N4JSG4_9PEZI|nr:FAD/NAD(P)-binding domain-containing protein [Choiromyces venosus 120613-1]
MFSRNAFFYLLTVCNALMAFASAQSTEAYTDPATGIAYQQFRTTAAGGFTFSIAFPSTPGTEFIGQIVAPRTADGWAGVSFGGGMNGNLLMVTWLNGNDVVSSFRMTSGYQEPTVYAGTTAPVATKMYTVLNTTHYSYTFCCQNCVSWTDGGFDPTANFTVMGWAVSSLAIGDKTNPASTLQHHDSGFGKYDVILTGTRSAQYAAWLAAAGIGGGDSTTATTTVPTSTSATTSAGPTATLVNLGEFDYIVAGGGAAGLVAAGRLSETGKKVLLVERGPPSTYATGGRLGPAWLNGKGLTRFDVPGLCNQIWVDSAGIACNDIDHMAGCVLGGGTAVNTGLFFKPQSRDWDYNFPTGWKATDMTSATDKVFTRIPSTDNPSMNGVRYLQESYDVVTTVLSAAGFTSVTANNSPNAKNRTFAHTPFMYSNGERGGPLATYLKTAKALTNFQIVTNTTVRRVIRRGGYVRGIEVFATASDGKTGYYTVTPSTGKVILAAGAFGTPKILLRSGIGPTDQLEVVKASATDGATMIDSAKWIKLPVGYNVLDHANTDVVISHPSVKAYDFYAAYNNPITADKDLYLNSRAGILATAAPGPNTIFWESIVPSDGIPRQLQWTVRAEGSLGESGDNLVTLSQYLGTGVKSRGRMTIRSNLNMAITTSPFLNDASDTEAVIKGIQSFMDAASGKNNITFLHPAPGLTATQYVNSYVGSRSTNHWIGSCKMGTDDGTKGDGSTGSVVDTNTKVYGTDNLFVIDASIFPGHITTNPSAPIMIAAERAVEKILALPVVPAATRYQQCGGINWTGAKACVSPCVCTESNPYYFQCL